MSVFSQCQLILEPTTKNFVPLLVRCSTSVWRMTVPGSKESGAWLHALPISAVGLRMGDDVIRLATGLCLGVPICRPHHCQHCYAEVDELGLHGLSCVKSAGRHFCHAAVNSIVQMSLPSAKIPSMHAGALRTLQE